MVAHSLEPQRSDQEAVEYLAVPSTVARWTDELTLTSPQKE